MSDPRTNDPGIDGREPEGLTPSESLSVGEQAATAAPLSPGAQLRACREQRGWTVEQVAAYLKLAPRQVVALENDDYQALPGMPIVRGFIRSYAKLLKIDAAPLLAQLGGHTVLHNDSLAPKESLSTPFAEARLPSMSERPAISSRWVLGLLLLVLLAVALWATQWGGDMIDFSSQPSAVIQQPVPMPPIEEAPEPAPVLQTEPAPDAAQGGDPQTAAPAAAPVSPASEAAPPAVAAASGTNTLSVTAREESWVEVRRANGNPLAARLMKAGESLSIEVTEPVVLVVGNAAGVDASLRGTPLQIKGSTATNVARINLK